MENTGDARRVTREDVESFAEKLEALASSLNDAERRLLSQVLATASVVGDTEEKDFSTPLANAVARAANFSKGEFAVPGTPLINPGILRAKNDNLFTGLQRK